MVMSLIDAKAAVQALTGSSAAFFDALKKNLTVHDKSHLSLVAAQAAIAGGKAVCGYYYQAASQTYYQSNADPTIEKERLGRNDKKSQWRRLTREIELPISMDDMAELCASALISVAGDLRRGNTDIRFLKVAPFKEGFGGRTLRAAGATTACVAVGVVISASPGASPQIVTHFPVDQAYVNAAALLV